MRRTLSTACTFSWQTRKRAVLRPMILLVLISKKDICLLEMEWCPPEASYELNSSGTCS